MKKERSRRGDKSEGCERGHRKKREKKRDNGNKKTKTNTCSQGKVNTKGKIEVTYGFPLKQSVKS